MDYRDGITCVIVGYRSLEYLKSCVESLGQQEGTALEIIIVDNNSADGTVEYFSELGLECISLDKNLGFGAAVNIGARKAAYKYMLILNPDTIVPPGSLKKLWQFAESRTGFGLLAPSLEYPDGKTQISARAYPRRRDFLLSRGSPLFRLGITGEKEGGYIVPEDNRPLEIPAVSATALLTGTALFNEIGGFDERFFMYLEDIDLCRRIKEKGLPVILIPEAKIRHSWKKSSSQRPFFTSYHHHLSVFKYFHKYEKKRIILNLGLAAALIFGFIFNVLIIIFNKAKSG
jgi:GT2 family glycosyltransferase